MILDRWKAGTRPVGHSLVTIPAPCPREPYLQIYMEVTSLPSPQQVRRPWQEGHSPTHKDDHWDTNQRTPPQHSTSHNRSGELHGIRVTSSNLPCCSVSASCRPRVLALRLVISSSHLSAGSDRFIVRSSYQCRPSNPMSRCGSHMGRSALPHSACSAASQDKQRSSPTTRSSALPFALDLLNIKNCISQ